MRSEKAKKLQNEKKNEREIKKMDLFKKVEKIFKHLPSCAYYNIRNE